MSSSVSPSIPQSPPSITPLTTTNTTSIPSISSQVQNSQAKKSFHLFPKLPYELRLKIFTHILSIPRVVNIAYVTKPITVQRNSEDDAIGIENGRGGGRRLFVNSNRARIIQGPRFVSRWVSLTPPPAALGVCRALREEALKIYGPFFGSLESPSRIFFNFEVDTLYFGNASISVNSPSPPPLSPSSNQPSNNTTKSITITPQPLTTDAAPYRLDLFLGGDYYGVSTLDFKRFKHVALDVAEDLYGRRSFCWQDIRNMSALESVTLVAWEEDEDAIMSPAHGSATKRERCMRSYHSSLSHTWKNYAQGYGEGLGAEGVEDGVNNAGWKIPRIEVWSAYSGKCWGEVKLVRPGE